MNCLYLNCLFYRQVVPTLFQCNCLYLNCLFYGQVFLSCFSATVGMTARLQCLAPTSKRSWGTWTTSWWVLVPLAVRCWRTGLWWVWAVGPRDWSMSPTWTALKSPTSTDSSSSGHGMSRWSRSSKSSGWSSFPDTSINQSVFYFMSVHIEVILDTHTHTHTHTHKTHSHTKLC